MPALLLFYMIKGFLGLQDNQAYAVYGAYTSLVIAEGDVGQKTIDINVNQEQLGYTNGNKQLGLGFSALWYGASMADERGMLSLAWLLLGYLFHTTGELCLSPLDLSMVTRLSPTRIVSTVMGAWFLATAFSAYVAGIIATFTGVRHDGDGGSSVPAPTETVDIYGNVFGEIAMAAVISDLIVCILAPTLTQWIHEGEDRQEAV